MNTQFSIGTPKYAGFWIRYLALIIDMIIFAVFAVILALIANALSPSVDLSYNAIAQTGIIYLFIIYLLVPFFYDIILTVQVGGTLGKKLTNIEVRKVDSLQRVDYGTAIGRYFAKILSALPLDLGFIWAGFDEKKQGWHDKLAGTVVLYPDTLTSPIEEINENREVKMPVAETLPMRGKPFAEIVFVKGLNKGKRYTLKGERIIIGRKASDVHIPIKDPHKFVSKIQSEIIRKNDRFYVRNLSSQDTTKLNGQTVRSPQPLRTNDIISFGNYAFKILFF